MTVTFAWWSLPVVLVFLGLASGAAIGRRSRGDYDVVTPLLALATFVAFAMLACGITLGRLFLH